MIIIVLSVKRDADAAAIKKLFVIAMKYHPDRNRVIKVLTKFKEAREAYEVLSDDPKQAYDQYGHAGVRVVWWRQLWRL